MKTTDIELKGSEIIRIKDGKVIADIVDGEVIPKAPVYYKNLDVLNAVAGGAVEEVSEKKPFVIDQITDDAPEGLAEPQQVEQDPQELIIRLQDEIDLLKDQNTKLRESVSRLAGGERLSNVVEDPTKALMEEVDWDKVPEADPSMGNRTPARKAYLIENHPKLATAWGLTK